MTKNSIDRIEKIKNNLEKILLEEREKYDEKSEEWQDSDKGEQYLNNIDLLENSIAELENIELLE